MKHPIFYVPFMVVKLAATLGLFLFVPWGRLLLVAVLLLGVVTTLLGGVAVIAPLDHLVLSMLYLSEGAILAISFTAPIATYFKPHVTNGRADD